MLNRRSFIKALAAMGGVLLLPLDRLAGSRIASVAQAQGPAPAEGELYEGFVLLSEGAPTPSFVRRPKYGIPRFGHGTPSTSAITTRLGSAEDLAAKIGLPVYTLSQLPEGLRPAEAILIQHPTGETYGGWVRFETYKPHLGAWACSVDVWLQPDFPQPFPVRIPRRMIEEDSEAVQRVRMLPTPGIAMRYKVGSVFQWIRGGVYYRLRVEQGASRGADDSLAATLTLVGQRDNR